MKMNKKGLAYEFVLLMCAIFLVLYVMFAGGDGMTEEIGHRQYLISKIMGRAELDLFSTDQNARYIVYDSIKETAAKGGYSGRPKCGIEEGYAIWSKKGKTLEDCYPNLMKELGEKVKTNLKTRGLEPENYDFYVDEYNVIGIASIPKEYKKQMTGEKGQLGSFEYYTKPSFNVKLNFLALDEYDVMKNFAKGVIASCSHKEQVKSCVDGKVLLFNGGKETGSLSSSQMIDSRNFKFEYKQIYKNIFTGDITIKFLIGLEGYFRIKPQTFKNTKLTLYNGTEEISFEAESSFENPSSPEKIEVIIPLEDYKGKKAEVSFKFEPKEEIKKSKFYYILDGKEKPFTKIIVNVYNRIKTLEGEEFSGIVNYYDELLSGEYVFYLNIPEEDKVIKIFADYTSESEEYANVISVDFKDKVKIPELIKGTIFLNTANGEYIRVDALETETGYGSLSQKIETTWHSPADYILGDNEIYELEPFTERGEFKKPVVLKLDTYFDTPDKEYRVYYTFDSEKNDVKILLAESNLQEDGLFSDVFNSTELIGAYGEETYNYLLDQAREDYTGS